MPERCSSRLTCRRQEQQAHGRLSSGHSGEHDGTSEAVVPRLDRNPFLDIDSVAQPARSESTTGELPAGASRSAFALPVAFDCYARHLSYS